jgi:hypothetical protein
MYSPVRLLKAENMFEGAMQRAMGMFVHGGKLPASKASGAEIGLRKNSTICIFLVSSMLQPLPKSRLARGSARPLKRRHGSNFARDCKFENLAPFRAKKPLLSMYYVCLSFLFDHLI